MRGTPREYIKLAATVLKGGGFCGWITPAPALFNPFNPSPGEYHLQLSCARASFSLKRTGQFCVHIG